MRALTSVKEVMSFIEDGKSKWVTLITACSEQEVYSNWCFNLPYEMNEADVTLIKINDEQHITLYIL